MFIGIAKITIRLPSNHNLKGKRKVVKSLCDRLCNEFSAAAAEVENLDVWQLATIGIACISNDSHHLQQILSKINNFLLENFIGHFELLNFKSEIISEVVL